MAAHAHGTSTKYNIDDNCEITLYPSDNSEQHDGISTFYQISLKNTSPEYDSYGYPIGAAVGVWVGDYADSEILNWNNKVTGEYGRLGNSRKSVGSWAGTINFGGANTITLTVRMCYVYDKNNAVSVSEKYITDKSKFDTTFTNSSIKNIYWSSFKITLKKKSPIVLSNYVGSDNIKTNGSFKATYNIGNFTGYTCGYTFPTFSGTLLTSIDGIMSTSTPLTLGNQSYTLADANFKKLSIGKHHFDVKVKDNSSGLYVIDEYFWFNILDDRIEIFLKPIATNKLVTKIMLGSLFRKQANDKIQIFASNNPYDTTTIWEDCTEDYLNKDIHYFQNKISSKYGVRVKLKIVKYYAEDI